MSLTDLIIENLPDIIAFGVVAAVVIICLQLITIKNQRNMKEAIQKLQADVQAEATVIASTKTLLSGLNQKLKDAITAADGGDTTALNELSAEIEAQTADLAAAVTTNTPAADAGSTS